MKTNQSKMAGYTNIDSSDTFWSTQEELQQDIYYGNPETDYQYLQSQQLDFQTFGDTELRNSPEIFTPERNYASDSTGNEEFDERPLLEELEIYPDRILEKTCAVLNPFRAHALADDAEFLTKDTDIGGPLCFCLLLAVCLFLSGNKAHFGYIYGLSVLSCISMYFLLTLMSVHSGIFTLLSVASILGYCLLPIVGLSVLGVFFSMHSNVGLLLAVLAVIWSSLSASRLFVAISGDNEQRPLIAYPCALVCSVFALLVIF